MSETLFLCTAKRGEYEAKSLASYSAWAGYQFITFGGANCLVKQINK